MLFDEDTILLSFFEKYPDADEEDLLKQDVIKYVCGGNFGGKPDEEQATTDESLDVSTLFQSLVPRRSSEGRKKRELAQRSWGGAESLDMISPLCILVNFQSPRFSRRFEEEKETSRSAELVKVGSSQEGTGKAGHGGHIGRGGLRYWSLSPDHQGKCILQGRKDESYRARRQIQAGQEKGVSRGSGHRPSLK